MLDNRVRVSDHQDPTFTLTSDSEDSDGDGLTLLDIGPDTDRSEFVEDADQTTTTDPNIADTDGDGLNDGEEDINQNGRTY